MKKIFILLCFLMIFGHYTKGQGEKEILHRLNLSSGILSPQQLFILKGHIIDNYSSDYYVQASAIPVSLSYERRNINRYFGLGLVFSHGQPEVLTDDPSNDFHALFKHSYFGGSFYIYPDKLFNLNKLGLYLRTNIGMLYIDKLVSTYNNSNAPDYWFEDQLITSFISVYFGIRYPIFRRFEVQTEIGYREASLIKFGFNVKI